MCLDRNTYLRAYIDSYAKKAHSIKKKRSFSYNITFLSFYRYTKVEKLKSRENTDVYH